jgi:glutathione synthase/RimK-type ligase-like ATP-grasp enzyme
MNKILVLAKNQNTYFIRRLYEEVDLNTLEIFDPFVPVKALKFEVPDIILCRTTGVYHDDQDLNFLQKQSTKIINRLSSLINFRSKSRQYEYLAQHSIRILPWKKCDSNLGGIQNYETLLIKPDKGQGGRGISVLKKNDFENWYNYQLNLNDTDFVIQPYFQAQKEFRIFFIDQRLWVLERWNDKGHAVNFNQSGYAKASTLTLALEAKVRELIEVSGATYGAIDLLVSESDHYFLELNAVPGVEQLEQIFKENIVKLLILMLFKK